MTSRAAVRAIKLDALLAFGLFGAFWGVWGASIPRIQDQASLSDGQIGLALLFIALAALPAMNVVGRAIDRFGLRVAGIVVPVFGIAGAAMSVTAHGLLSLCIGLCLVGATSGASDVTINSLAGYAEIHHGGPVITRSHATFSVLVVLGSIGTSLCAAASLRVWVPFMAIALLSVAIGGRFFRTLPDRPAKGTEALRSPSSAPVGKRDWHFVMPLALVGILGALAFASENAYQSWSAVFAHDVLHTSLAAAAGAPALFAAVVAATRFAIGRVHIHHAIFVVTAGSAVAVVGAALLAVAPNLGVAAVGLILAAAGTGVLFPTLMRMVSRSAAASQRGRATSLVTSFSYLGFLLGPVYVGAWADGTSLRGAMWAIGALGVVLAMSARSLLHRAGMGSVISADLDRAATVTP